MARLHNNKRKNTIEFEQAEERSPEEIRKRKLEREYEKLEKYFSIAMLQMPKELEQLKRDGHHELANDLGYRILKKLVKEDA